MRFQIQEMARAEKMVSDEQIQRELDIYNALIPEPGELSATLFIELTGEDALRDWLPRLVGIEHAVVLRLRGPAAPAGAGVRSCGPCPRRPTRRPSPGPTITASVHYIRFALDPAQVERFAAGPGDPGRRPPRVPRTKPSLSDESAPSC